MHKVSPWCWSICRGWHLGCGANRWGTDATVKEGASSTGSSIPTYGFAGREPVPRPRVRNTHPAQFCQVSHCPGRAVAPFGSKALQSGDLIALIRGPLGSCQGHARKFVPDLPGPLLGH
jgi:hypothetical protein